MPASPVPIESPMPIESPVPIEPPPSVYGFWPPGLPDGEDFLGTGGDLAPSTLLEAYRSGAFPMPGSPRISRGAMGWWSPDPRGVLPLDGLKISKSLRASVRRAEVRYDTAFAAVIRGCADRRRPGRWIRSDVAAAYVRLYELGWAHSVEVWRDEVLVGGLYGVQIGGLFAGESMFHKETDASKVALVALVALLNADANPQRLLDVQWQTPHLASLGVVAIPRKTYLARLEHALRQPPARWPPPQRHP